MTESELDVLVEGFLDHSLPVTQWTHHAHCRVTAWLLLTRPDIDLPAELPDLIRAYNAANGGQNTDTSGYHHTITLFYLIAIRAFLAMQVDRDAAVTCQDMLTSPIGDKAFPLRYYSAERLFSKAARLEWLTPDLKPFEVDDLRSK